MAALFDNNPAFSLGLRSPELTQFMYDDRYNPNSPTRGLMGKAPEGPDRRVFGTNQVSLRQAQMEHGQSIKQGKAQTGMAIDQASRKMHAELKTALQAEVDKNNAKEAAKVERTNQAQKDKHWGDFVRAHGGVV